jgi:hypothetical protein
VRRKPHRFDDDTQKADPALTGINFVVRGKGKMSSREHFEKTATSIASLNRNELERRITSFKGGIKLDFTPQYLHKLSVDRLRHILLAAIIHTGSHN